MCCNGYDLASSSRVVLQAASEWIKRTSFYRNQVVLALAEGVEVDKSCPLQVEVGTEAFFVVAPDRSSMLS